MSEEIIEIITEEEDIIIEVSPEGEDGNGIAAIELLTTVGLDKTYRITYTDGTHFDYTVTDGADGEPGVSEWGGIGGDIDDQTDLANALAEKADADDVYTKLETDSLLDDKADSDDVYTKAQVDTALSAKANTDDVYTQDETDTLLVDKAAVITETASGPIAHIEDGAAAPVTSLIIGIEPMQDLHGQSNPYPAGGGKNLFNYENTDITFANMEQSGSVFSNTNTDSRTFFNFQFRALNNGTIVVTSDAQSISSTGRKSATITISETITHVSIVHNGSQRNLSVTYPFTGQGTFTISFDVTAYNPSSVGGLSFTDVQLELGSTATAFAPYENICPITGHTVANITRTEKNLLDKQLVNGYLSINNCLKSGYTYTVSADIINQTATYLQIRRAPKGSDISQNWTNIGSVISNTTIVPRSFTADLSTYDYTLWTTSTYLANIKNVQLELGSTASDFESYQGQQVILDFGQTVYSGSVDVKTGVLTVTHAMVDMGDLSYTLQGSGYAGSTFLAYITTKQFGAGNFITSQYKTDPTPNLENIPNGSARGRVNTYGIYIRDDRYSDATAFKTAVTGQQLVYALDNPQTYQLTPAQITTLLGVNNIFSDAGDVNIGYRADTKLYIQRLTKPTEDDMVANANIPSGKFFSIGNSLYLSTTAITAGSTIVPGSNCTALSLADALNQINQ